MTIGVLDSGIGGLTVAKAILNRRPDAKLVYFGDTAHFPYGEKSESAIQSYVIKIANLLLFKGCDVIVLACNSASASAYDLLTSYVGSKAVVINVIDPVVELVNNEFSGKVGLIGTKRTVDSGVYASKLGVHNKVQLGSLATPLLAPMIEEGYFNNEISTAVIDEYLGQEALSGISGLILGCTHYPLVKSNVEAYYQGKVKVIDSAEEVAKKIEVLNSPAETSGDEVISHEFFVSDYTDSFQKSTSTFFGQEIELELYPLWD